MTLLQIPGFKNYLVSDIGEVFSVKRKKFLKPSLDKDGYIIFCLSDKKQKAHRLVLAAFTGEFKNLECRHLDGNKQNNNISNLKWGTRSENERDKYRHGTANVGEQHGRAKLNSESVSFIRKATESRIELAKKFKVSKSLIDKVIQGDIWKHL